MEFGELSRLHKCDETHSHFILADDCLRERIPQIISSQKCYVGLDSGIHRLISFKLGLMIETAMFYSFTSVLMILKFI